MREAGQCGGKRSPLRGRGATGWLSKRQLKRLIGVLALAGLGMAITCACVVGTPSGGAETRPGAGRDPSPPVTFSAQVNVLPAASEVAIGETLVVTVSIDVVRGCQFPIYELTLRPSAPGFAYASPLTQTVGPPVSNPFAYTLTAVEAGTVTFEAVAYGERNCNDYWNWQYLSGRSAPVRVR